MAPTFSFERNKEVLGLTSSDLISELRNCVEVEVDVLSSLSLTVLMVIVDIKQH